MSSLVIRADADGQMGTGHVMRCIALAHAWLQTGRPCAFATRTTNASLLARIRDYGANLHALPDGDAEAELQSIRRSSDGPLWLVIDGYQFDTAYHQRARELGLRVLLVDDYAHLQRYSPDIILNQNIGAEHLAYNCDPGVTRLLGPHYALLRPEFMKHSGHSPQATGAATRVLVTLGGADPDNVTEKVLLAAQSLAMEELQLRAVVGPANPHLSALKRYEESGRVQLLTDVRDMPSLMEWADVAVSAAGSTCWELALMGVPSLLITVADNQMRIAKYLGEAGAARSLGWHADVTPPQIAAELAKVLGDAELRRRLAARAAELVDGRGAARVVQAMDSLAKPFSSSRTQTS